MISLSFIQHVFISFLEKQIHWNWIILASETNQMFSFKTKDTQEQISLILVPQKEDLSFQWVGKENNKLIQKWHSNQGEDAGLKHPERKAL